MILSKACAPIEFQFYNIPNELYGMFFFFFFFLKVWLGCCQSVRYGFTCCVVYYCVVLCRIVMFAWSSLLSISQQRSHVAGASIFGRERLYCTASVNSVQFSQFERHRHHRRSSSTRYCCLRRCRRRHMVGLVKSRAAVMTPTACPISVPWRNAVS